MSKIKSVSQFEDNIWGEATPIGADASNIDVEMSDSSTKDLQTVLGDIPSAAAPIQSQINTKVTASGGNIGNTTVSSGIQNFDSSSSETSTELLDTSVRVTNATEVTSSMWTKFNRFRKRVDNKFKDVFLSSVEDVASPSDYKTYSQSALNDYFANVVGYASASDLPDATSTIAQQLSTLNNNIASLTREEVVENWYNNWESNGLYFFKIYPMIFCMGGIRGGVMGVNNALFKIKNIYAPIESSLGLFTTISSTTTGRETGAVLAALYNNLNVVRIATVLLENNCYINVGWKYVE